MPERRHFERFYFSADDRITASIAVIGSKTPLNATVLDICAVGMGMILSKAEYPNLRLRKGEHLILRQITSFQGLKLDTRLEMKIRWLVSHEFMDHIGFGCHFPYLSKEKKDAIRIFLNSWCEKNSGTSDRNLLTQCCRTNELFMVPELPYRTQHVSFSIPSESP